MKKIMLITIMATIVACATPMDNQAKVDGSSKESTDASLDKMMNALSNKDHCRLQTAILRIQLGDPALMSDKKLQKAVGGEPVASNNNLGKKINGFTAGQIIALSEQYPAKITGMCVN